MNMKIKLIHGQKIISDSDVGEVVMLVMVSR